MLLKTALQTPFTGLLFVTKFFVGAKRAPRIAFQTGFECMTARFAIELVFLTRLLEDLARRFWVLRRPEFRVGMGSITLLGANGTLFFITQPLCGFAAVWAARTRILAVQFKCIGVCTAVTNQFVLLAGTLGNEARLNRIVW